MSFRSESPSAYSSPLLLVGMSGTGVVLCGVVTESAVDPQSAVDPAINQTTCPNCAALILADLQRG